jgi:ACS family tartrate transporter-like MFS transporter
VRSRVLPFFFLLYIIAYIDRANVTFAKLSMQADLKFSEQVFGLGAGIFFIGYLVLEIPGALIMERWSARLWIARILVSWGLVTVALGFIQSANEFYALRLVLGFAEAGFFPGLIVYLSRWFPLGGACASNGSLHHGGSRFLRRWCAIVCAFLKAGLVRA